VAWQLNERSRETLGFETQAERDLMLVLHRPIEPTAQSGHPILSMLQCYSTKAAEHADAVPPDAF